jgi:hypothetical protein
MMEQEQMMQEELYKTDFCFPIYNLNDIQKDYDYTQKFYAFDCNIGSFCCYANKENILKIIEIAKKYNLEDLFLNKSFNKMRLLNFKQKTNKEYLKEYNLPENSPVIFWFLRGYNIPIIDAIYLRDYLEL